MASPSIKPKKTLWTQKGGRDLVAVELDENFLKIAHVNTKGLKREISNAVVHSAQGVTDEGIVLLLRQAVQKFHAQDPRIILMVPLTLVITRNIEIPSQDPAEIKEIVNLQASRHTPYARAEIIVDMLNLGVVRERYSKVLLVIVPKESVNRQIQLLDLAGLRLERVVFPPEAISIHMDRIFDREAKGEPFAFLHMDESFTSFVVTQGGKTLFMRGIHIGAAQLTNEREVYMDRFRDEIEKSVESYTTDEVGMPPKFVALTSGPGSVPDLEEIVTELLHLPVRKFSCTEHFVLSNEARSVIQASSNHSFLNILCTLVFAEKIRVDLTSEEKRLKITLEKRAKEMLKMGVVTMVILSLLVVNVATKISFKRSYLKQLTTHYLPVREAAKNLEGMLAKTELVKAYLLNRGDSLETLTELYDATPMDIKLIEIKYDESSAKFSIKGTSAAMSSVFAFVTELDKSSVFKNVKTKYVTARNDAGRDVADFEINANIESKVGRVVS